MLQKLKNYYHWLQALLANVLYDWPSRRVTVIGVTGTDGKTTTTSLIYHILKTAGKKVAMVTSVGAAIGDTQYDIGFHVTTPSSFDVQKYIQQAVDQGSEYVVLETTSHALDQYRVWGVLYRIAVLTNITHEHLDYHPTYEAYVATKRKLLEMAPVCIINKEDESYRLIEPYLAGKVVTTYALRDASANLTPKKYPFQTKLVGNFNIMNSLAATGVAKALDISDTDIQRAFATFRPPAGRQEVVYDEDFMVMIDFAHTPNSFHQILPELKKQTKGKLIHVFGSAGLRDASKRPLMGEASSVSADIIVLTAEDPRTESLDSINTAILSGITKKFDRVQPEEYRPGKMNGKMVFRIDDRTQAIQFAIGLAQKGDTVVCTGKSHEKSMNYGQGEVPWDEFAAVRNAIELKKKKSNKKD